MEMLQVIEKSPQVEILATNNNTFIEANTIEMEYEELQKKSTIPVFARDNESTISHQEFIETTGQAIRDYLNGYRISAPNIRVSHPVKGRISEAVGLPVSELKDYQKTVYYERMAFLYEVPDICDTVNNNSLNLTIGGVRAYNFDNLSGRKTEERFKVFIGFKNIVCMNLCITTDGYKTEIRARTLHELYEQIFKLVSSFDAVNELIGFRDLGNYSLSESQFAQMIGRSRMYQYLPRKDKKEIQAFPLMDSHVATISKQYFEDESFSRKSDGNIDLWRLYNLFTGANKSSYIDNFLDRNLGSGQFILSLKNALKEGNSNWYLN